MHDVILKDMVDYLAAAHSQYHAVALQCEQLEKAGYHRLTEAQPWLLENGQGYYVTRNDSSLIAFRLPNRQAKRFMMTASHSDSPTLKLKDVPDLQAVNGVKRLNVEGYGSALLHPWFDRPLGVAGRVAVRTEQGVEMRLYASERPLAMIPSLAIHMDRDANHGHDLVRQKEIVPLYGLEEAPDLLSIVAEDLGLRRADILAHDLMLYNTEPPRLWAVPFPIPSSPFYKIVVPTVDTVRYNYLVSTMVASQNPVLLVGPVGTGKTSIAQSVLQSLPSSQWSVLTVNMSAQVCGRTHGPGRQPLLSPCLCFPLGAQCPLDMPL